MDWELRRDARMAMRGVPERLGLRFADGHIELRSKPSGHGTTNFEWNGYATVYGSDFEMWDQNGERFTESVGQGAAKRSLANPNLDVPFLIGHNNAGVPLARTKSGTMTLSEDSRGVLSHVPEMDGRREEVRALASAVERGDLDEMSLAFICLRQQWDAGYEHRTVLEMDLHRGDVCAVTHGANPATAGAWMAPVEQLSFRRPASIGAPRLLGRERRAPTVPYIAHPGETNECSQCKSVNDDTACFCDQCGTPMRPVSPMSNMAGVEDMNQGCPCGHWNSTDAKFCGACGRNMTGEGMAWSAGRAYELLSSVTQAERDKAKKAGNSLPDGSYPINNVAQLKAAATLAASHHGGWKAAQALIRSRAKDLGVDVTTLPGFGEKNAAAQPLELRAAHAPFTGTHSHPHTASGDQGGDATHDHEHSHDGDAAHGHPHESRAAGRPVELRASAASDIDAASAPDYDPAATDHPQAVACGACGGNGRLPHPVAGADADGPVCPGCNGTGAVVTVDDSTGIPGPEVQMSAARRLELRMRELEMDELARR